MTSQSSQLPHRSASIASLLLVVSVCGGCLDTKSGRRGGEPDTAQSEVAADVISPCERSDFVLRDQGTTSLGNQSESPLLDRTVIYGTVAGPDWRENLTMIDIATNVTRTIPDPGQTHFVIDARDGVVLYGRTDGEGVTEVRYHDFTSDTDELLASYPGTGTTRVAVSRFQWGRRGRSVERGVAVWAEFSYEQSKVRQRVKMWRGGVVKVVWEGFAPSLVVELRDGDVAIASDGEGPGVWFTRGGDAPMQVGFGEIRELAINDTGVLWLDDGKVWRHDVSTGRTEALGGEGCAALVADGSSAAAVCGVDPASSWYIAAPGSPTVFEGGRVVTIPVPKDVAIAGMDLFAGRLAWVEYDAIAAQCGSDPATGTLRGVSLRSPAAPVDVATVGAGCWCCDAYWPPLQIDLSAEGLAWNYAVPAADAIANGSPIGWGLFESCE